jgi:23S rRNA pseudouridine1911/1915/1917 synthase
MYLSALFKDFSRSYIQKLIDEWKVRVNSKIVNKNLKIKNKDEINIDIIAQKLIEVNAENIPLDIIFEDDNILIINKDAGINVHPVPWENGKSWTIVNAILYHCKNKLPNINWVERPWIVHRLDKDTSWVMMIAKNDFMMSYLSNIIKNRDINKYYLAVVFWKIKDRIFKIESFIWRDPNNRLKMTTNNPVNPKVAITSWEVLEFIDNKYSLVKIKIETGRTHQIRVHLSSIGFPIIWDKLYWNFRVNKEVATKYQLKRHALHAYELGFELYNKKTTFKAELKDDMKRIIWDLLA